MTAPERPDWLATCVADVQRACRACVVVAGSWGSNEATIDGSSGAGLSDVELAVVGGLRTYVRVRRARRHGVGGNVELYWVSSSRMRCGRQRNIGPIRPSVSAFDLARQPRTGDLPRRAKPPRVWQARDLSRREAVSLLGNRVGELLGASEPSYARVKVGVSVGDAMLIAAGEYELGYAERARRFAQLPDLPDAIEQVVIDSYAAKLGRRELELDPLAVREAVRSAISNLLDTSQLGDPAAVRRGVSRCWAQEAAAHPLSGVLERSVHGLRGARVVAPRAALAAACGRERADVVAYADLLSHYATVGEDPHHERRRSVVAAWKAYCF